MIMKLDNECSKFPILNIYALTLDYSEKSPEHAEQFYKEL